MNVSKVLGFSTIAFAQILVLLLNLSTSFAAPLPHLERKTVKAPPLQSGKVSAAIDLGLWDNVFVVHDQDFIVVRRGGEFFSLSMEASAKPKKLAAVPAADNTQIISGTAVEKRIWLFLNSEKAIPCAVDVVSGTVVTFDIPKLKVPGSQAPGIQWCRVVPHVSAGLFMVSGGDRATWPRDGNRPVFFWMDLKSGKVIRLPIGWDLEYFSADERVAASGSKNAIDLNTGERTDAVPDRRKAPHIPFDWTNTQKARTLYERRQGMGDADYFAGLSVDGRVLPVNLGLEEVRYLAQAKSDDAFAGFRLRESGKSNGDPTPFWMFPLMNPKKTELIANDVNNFTMLGQGSAVYVMAEKVAKPSLAQSRRLAEAYFYSDADRTSWNMLDGIDRAPKLTEAFAEAEFVHESLDVRLVEGFGTNQHRPLLFCMFEHSRADLRAFVRPMEKVLEPVKWRRGLFVTQEGKRFLTPLFRGDDQPSHIWLHKSGRLISGAYVWDESKPKPKRRLQLSAVSFQQKE